MRPPPSAEVFVVWPPVWNAFDLHVAVPALCGHLSRHGLRARSVDLNIEFFRWLVAEETLETLVRRSPALPPRVARALAWVRRYHEVLRTPLPAGCAGRFSEDAEQLLLTEALAIFNHFHPEATCSTLGVYHQGDAEDSDFIAELAARDAGNPFSACYRERFVPELARDRPALVGISISGPFQLAAAFTLARVVKEVDPRIQVVIGGAFFSTIPGVLLRQKTGSNLFKHVDAFVFNEGELPLLRIARDVLSGNPPAPGPNVLLPRQRALTYEPRHCLAASEIARPAFGPGAVKKYFRPVSRVPVEVSRGCYWGKCSFCNLATGSNERYRAIPVEKVLSDIEALTREQDASCVLFSTLAMAPALLRRISRHVLDSRERISWTTWARPESALSEEDVDLFARAGCSSLAITPESFCETTLQRMRKGFELEHVVRIVRHLVRVGLCGTINIIPGFPGETVDEFLATMEVCRELGVKGELFPFCLLKSSPIYRHASTFGIVVHERPEKDLAMSLPFEHTHAPSPSGLELIRIAARRYPANVFADDPLSGYTFDFSGVRSR
jgi:hypothetical protein